MTDLDNESNRGFVELDWAQQITYHVAGQVSYWRGRREMSAKRLSDQTAAIGHRIPRSVITNLENGRRDNITIAEIWVLAAALDVPPIMLMTPLGTKKRVWILPGVSMSPWEVRGWVMGVRLPAYRTRDVWRWREVRAIVGMFDALHSLVQEFLERRSRMLRRISSALPGTGQASTDDTLREIDFDAHLNELTYTFERIQEARRQMIQSGIVASDLPANVSTKSLSGISSDDAGGRTYVVADMEGELGEENVVSIRRSGPSRPTGR